MAYRIPDRIKRSIADGTWRDPGSGRLRAILSRVPDLPEMVLFETDAVMQTVAEMLETHGYVDNPEFCMLRLPSGVVGEPRLVFATSVFIAGSKVPGDDVFVAVSADNNVVVFDWSRSVPTRWVTVMGVDAFCDLLRPGRRPRRPPG